MAKKTGRSRTSSRERIDTGRDKRYVRRRATGTFKESDDVGRASSSDRRVKAKTAAKKGQGDRGDRRETRARKAATKKR
jgi:hypothetical protein